MYVREPDLDTVFGGERRVKRVKRRSVLYSTESWMISLNSGRTKGFYRMKSAHPRPRRAPIRHGDPAESNAFGEVVAQVLAKTR